MCLSFTVHTSGFETASLCVLLTGSVNPQQRRVIGCVSPSKMVLVLSPSGFLSVNSHFSRSNMIQSQDVFLASRDEAHYSSFPDLNGRVSLSLYLSIYMSFFLSFFLLALPLVTRTCLVCFASISFFHPFLGGSTHHP